MKQFKPMVIPSGSEVFPLWTYHWELPSRRNFGTIHGRHYYTSATPQITDAPRTVIHPFFIEVSESANSAAPGIYVVDFFSNNGLEQQVEPVGYAMFIPSIEL